MTSPDEFHNTRCHTKRPSPITPNKTQLYRDHANSATHFQNFSFAPIKIAPAALQTIKWCAAPHLIKVTAGDRLITHYFIERSAANTEPTDQYCKSIDP